MYEIYLNSDNSALVVENHKTGETVLFTECGISFYVKIDDAVKLQYPETHAELCQLFGHNQQQVFARTRAFLACNFSVKDGKPDIDEDWNFNLENVPCPARISGICKHEICNPKISHELTARELEVLILFAKGLSEEEIAEMLFISKSTVHNHINNMYKKVGLVGKTSPDRKLVNYAYAKKII